MRVMLSQCNPTVGDLEGNLQLMLQEIAYAIQHGCHVIVFPELVTTGYPPRDLLHREEFWDSHEQLITQLQVYIYTQNSPITVIFGGLHRVFGTYNRVSRYNAAFIIDNINRQTRVVHKTLLPSYDVFDEARHFQPSEPGRRPIPITVGVTAVNPKPRPSDEDPRLPLPINVGTSTVDCDVLICEDIWNYKFRSADSWAGSYDRDPVSELTGDGPIFVLNGSPFWEGKIKHVIQLVESICQGTGRPVIYVNQVGAHDDIVTHGGSLVCIPFDYSPRRRVLTRVGNLFTTDQMIVDIEYHGEYAVDKLFPRGLDQPTGGLGLRMPEWFGKQITEQDFDIWCDWQALRLFLTDYCRRTGFKEVVLGLSGGIDSAVVCALAADALGAKNVHGIAMPSVFSSEGSIIDAKQLADNLAIGTFEVISIGDMHQDFRSKLLSGGQQKFQFGVTDENIQPRLRMILLMARSNDYGWLLLTTGNKSELAVGYCTLYGDMAGGLAVISDIPKIRVFEMAECYNKYKRAEVIPLNTIRKAPSAELAPGQKDTDSLPPYSVLDPILEMIYRDVSISDIIQYVGNPKLVRDIIARVERNEYKRRQIPDGPKVRSRSFGSGRRMPVAAKYTLLKGATPGKRW